jgi:UDP-N-acetylglucosamine--N-acetylmuramyl-(pentapeptide) pyrophosphoryl-undecaprenol N-acetylglucosamine transferase
MKSRKIVFAGGGTAGHIQPALAVARLWRQSHPNDHIVFLGTASGLEERLVPEAGFELQLITRVRVPRSLSSDLIKVPGLLRRSIRESKGILKDADLLIGFGGYVCAPAYLAAASLKVPIVIHEANAKPGWANRLGARYTKALAVGSPVADGPFATALITGLPLRDDITTVLSTYRSADEGKWREVRMKAKSDLGISHENKVIFVFGDRKVRKRSMKLSRVLEDYSRINPLPSCTQWEDLILYQPVTKNTLLPHTFKIWLLPISHLI